MAYAYWCDNCLDGDHVYCEESRPAPPGLVGGGRCICPHGDVTLSDFQAKVMEQSEVQRRHRPS